MGMNYNIREYDVLNYDEYVSKLGECILFKNEKFSFAFFFNYLDEFSRKEDNILFIITDIRIIECVIKEDSYDAKSYPFSVFYTLKTGKGEYSDDITLVSKPAFADEVGDFEISFSKMSQVSLIREVDPDNREKKREQNTKTDEMVSSIYQHIGSILMR